MPKALLMENARPKAVGLKLRRAAPWA